MPARSPRHGPDMARTRHLSASDVAALTPPDRDRFVDLARRDAVAVAVVAVCVFGLSRVGLDGIATGTAESVAGVAVPAWMFLTGLAAGVLVLRSSGPRPTVAA